MCFNIRISISLPLRNNINIINEVKLCIYFRSKVPFGVFLTLYIISWSSMSCGLCTACRFLPSAPPPLHCTIPAWKCSAPTRVIFTEIFIILLNRTLSSPRSSGLAWWHCSRSTSQTCGTACFWTIWLVKSWSLAVPSFWFQLRWPRFIFFQCRQNLRIKSATI